MVLAMPATAKAPAMPAIWVRAETRRMEPGASRASRSAIGSQAAAIAIATSVYPTTLRATGTGWALGAGLFGQLLVPFLSNEIAALHWPASRVFVIAALLAFAATIAALAIVMTWRDPVERAVAVDTR
jgi:hypothetical protein